MEPSLENVQEREGTVRPQSLLKLQTILEKVIVPNLLRTKFVGHGTSLLFDTKMESLQSLLYALSSGLVSLIDFA